MKIYLILSLLAIGVSTKEKRPNIVLIVADDLGWDDVSFHGSDQIYTPNIDQLAMTGKALGRYYSHCICTPSRSALLTGNYAHRIGMQGYPLTNGEDRGVPLTEKLLPEYLKELGYATHLVGKWHIGQSRKEFLPTARGFDSHIGHRGGFISYSEYLLDETWGNSTVTGFGLFRDDKPAWDVSGYVTDVYTKEAISVIQRHDVESPLFLMVGHNAPHAGNIHAALETPSGGERAMRHVELSSRRTYAAMVKKLDDGVGDVVEALLNKGILNDTVIVFVADNGGMTSGLAMNYASNWPLRGLKMSPYEGGIRVTGLIWSSNFQNANNYWDGYIHVSDWLPTFLRIAGAEPPKDITGIDLWDSINSGDISKRDEVVEIDDYTGFASIISGDFKLITGTTTKEYSNYQGGDLRGIIGTAPSYTDAVEESKMYHVLEKMDKPLKKTDLKLLRKKIKVECNEEVENVCYTAQGTVCLFNIKEDPCETTDLAEDNPDIVRHLLNRLLDETNKTIPRTVPFVRDPRSRPSLHNYVWDTFIDSETD